MFKLDVLRNLKPIKVFFIRCRSEREFNDVINENYFLCGELGEIKEIYIIKREVFESINRWKNRVKAGGMLAGWIKGENYLPSPYVFTNKCIVRARKKGIELFLYGRDLLKESVIEVLNPVKVNWYVGVMDERDHVIGVGRMIKYIEDSKESEVIVKNLFDLARLIRYQGMESPFD